MKPKEKKKRLFLVGRLDRKATTVLFLERLPQPIVGPWTLRALVAPN
jgi:hypothetical protein